MKYIAAILIFLSITCACWFSYHNFIYSPHTYKIANNEGLKIDVDKKIFPAFALEEINNIALITMVKDESDIIFENLVWHFCLGFRKFFIIDNNSTDGTRQIIAKFAELTKNRAKVFILEDPIFEHIQSRIMTGAYDFVRSLWPEVKWVFPVDADEFWLPEQNINQILEKIPDNFDSISTLRISYRPSDDYYNFDPKVPFYKKIHFREKKLTAGAFKAAIRATDKDLAIAQGNHVVLYQHKKHINLLRKLKFMGQIEAISGNDLGLQMVEYHMRSTEQAHKKLYNGMRASLAAKEQKLIENGIGLHWDQYKSDLEKYGQEAGKIRFEQTFIKSEEAIDDPLPIDHALKIFTKIIAIPLI
jgi:glycosyltransferase involved in cell wall biosynthesis